VAAVVPAAAAPESQEPPRDRCASGTRSPDVASARARCLRVLLHHPHQAVHYRYQTRTKEKARRAIRPTHRSYGHFGSFAASLRSFCLRRPPARAACEERDRGSESETGENCRIGTKVERRTLAGTSFGSMCAIIIGRGRTR